MSAIVHYRWDVDKTYIRTEFDTFRDLVRAWRQEAEDKTNIPGAPALLRELLATRDRDQSRVTFISGSPRQMRRVLSDKFRLDGVEPDAFILKPNLSNILLMRWKAVNNQVGYKLAALLDSRSEGADEYLFGDDSEQDALIYSMYADMLSGDIGADELQETLLACGVYEHEVEALVRRYGEMTQSGVVRRVFIHLDRRSPLQRFLAYGPRVVAVYNYFQAAVILHANGVLSVEGVARVVESMRLDGYTPTRLANSVRDLLRRGFINASVLDEMLGPYPDDASGFWTTDFFDAFLEALDGVETTVVRRVSRPVRIDYGDLIERHRYKRPETPKDQLPGFLKD